jgi:hypothetical protein
MDLNIIKSLRGRDGQKSEFSHSLSIEDDEKEDGEENLVAEALAEEELIPDAAAALGDFLDRLGRQLQERKEQLMAGKS